MNYFVRLELVLGALLLDSIPFAQGRRNLSRFI